MAQRAIRQHTTRLLEVARAGTCNPGEMQLPIRSVADTVHQLSSHCNVTLVNDALKNLHEAMANPPGVCVCVCVCVCVVRVLCVYMCVCEYLVRVWMDVGMYGA